MIKPVNARQFDVLKWIAEGCPDGRWPAGDFTYKTTAGVLRSRGLVTIKGRAQTWQAAVTEVGTYYLNHHAYPSGHSGGGSRRPGAQRAAAGAAVSSVMFGEKASETLEEAKTLLREVKDAGGAITIPDPSDSVRARYRRLLHACRLHHLVTAGQELRFTGRDSGDIVISIGDTSEESVSDWLRIRTTSRRITTNLASLRNALDTSTVLDAVSEELRPRAVDVVCALAEELQVHDLKLGVNVKLKSPKLFLQVDTQRRDIFISETTKEVPHKFTPVEERELRKMPWKSFPKVDKVPDGKLHLTVDRDGWSSGGGRNQDEWTDAPRAPLEQQVEVIAKAIKRGVIDDRDARERAKQARAEAIEQHQRELAEERRVWEGIRAEARVRTVERLREAAFMDTFDAWRGAQELRSFAGELEAAVSENDELSGRPRLREWLEWARQRADEMDPVMNLGRLDDSVLDFEPSADELRPYMQGWDPSVPHKDYSLSYANAQRQAPPISQRRPWHPGLRGKPSWWR